MTVCLSGNINQDIIFSLKRFPDCHEKIVTNYYYIGQGGSAANVAWWLASLGSKARMIGCVGRDRIGDDAIEELGAVGVDTSSIVRSCRRTGLATIMSCGQDKRMIKVDGANVDIVFKEEDYFDARHIHISSLRKDLAESIIYFANRSGTTISWDPSGSIYGDLLEHVDHLFINEDDAKRNADIIAEHPPKNLVMTLNDGGCRINDSINVGSFGQETVDTTGAGDAFDAGFIHGLENGLSLKECGRWGVACASRNVMAVGSRDGFTSREDIIKKVKDGP